MKTVTKEERKLCAKALREFATAIYEDQAENGNRIAQDFRDAVAAEELAQRFEEETSHG